LKKTQIILIEYREYPLERIKKIGENSIECGLGLLLENIEKFDSGLNFEITLIVTGMHNPYYELCLKTARYLRYSLFPHKYSKDKINIYKEKKSIYKHLKNKYSFITSLEFKDNIGLDIGAYNLGYQLLKNRSYNGDVIFMNSALSGPTENNWLIKYKRQFLKMPNIGLCGITMNALNHKLVSKPFSPHVQSFFLYSNMNILTKVFPENLPGSLIKNDRTAVIIQGEIGISQEILKAGYYITCISEPDFFYKNKEKWAISYDEIRTKKQYYKFCNTL